MLGQLRDQLDSSGAGADDADALAGELDAVLRPARGVVPVAVELLEAVEGRPVDRREAPRRHHAVPRGEMAPVRGHDLPAPARLVVTGAGDPRVQLDVAAEVEAVGDVVQVAEDFRPGRIALGPVPLLLELLGERVGVVQRLDIAAHARVAVPVPGAADAVALLEHPYAQAHASQAMQGVQPGEAGADDDRVEVGDIELVVDRLRDEVEPSGAPGHEPDEREEAVQLALEALVLHPDAGCCELLRVKLALVAQDVVLGGQDHRRRQSGQALGAQRRSIWIDPHRGVGCIVVPEPLHRRAADDQLVLRIEIRRPIEVAIGDGVHEHLQRDLRSRFTRALCDHRGEVASGAVTGDDQWDAPTGDPVEVCSHPLECRPCVAHRSRVSVLGCEPVVHQHNRAVGSVREQARQRVELIQRTGHPAAAVVVDDHPSRGFVRDEDSHGDPVAVADRDLELVHPRHRRALAVALDHLLAGLPRLRRGQLVHRRHAARREPCDEICARLIKHRLLLACSRRSGRPLSR